MIYYYGYDLDQFQTMSDREVATNLISVGDGNARKCFHLHTFTLHLEAWKVDLP